MVYWPLPDAKPFDTLAFVSGIRAMVHQTIALFGRAPYRDYTFQFEDGAFGGGLEPSQKLIGAALVDLGSHAMG